MPLSAQQMTAMRLRAEASPAVTPLWGAAVELARVQGAVAGSAATSSAQRRSQRASARRLRRTRPGRGQRCSALCPPSLTGKRTYLLYHPDLRASGVSTEAQAKQHYIKQGRAEGRVYKRLRVIVRYTACTGAIYQNAVSWQRLPCCDSLCKSMSRRWLPAAGIISP